MSSDQNSTQVTHIGDHLRARREEIKLSIEKVSQKTKINLNILRALEANNFQALPSPAYIKGFVMSYARVVGLNPDDVVNKLEYSYLTLMGKPFPALNHTRNYQTVPEAEAQPEGASSKRPVGDETPADVLAQEQRSHDRKRVVIPAIVFVGVCLVFTGLYQLITKTIDGETQSVSDKPYGPTFVPSSELVEMNKPVSAPKTESAPEAAASAAPDKPEGKTETPAATIAPVQNVRRNFPHKDFRKITVRLFAILPDAPESSDPKIFPTQIKDSFNREAENVYITAAEGSTWLTYKVDQTPIQSVILDKGKDIFLQGKEVLVFLGNVKMVKVFYQNRLIDAPSKTGFKSLVFPESRSAQHVLPLFPKAADDILYTAEEYQRRMKIEEEELKAKGLL